MAKIRTEDILESLGELRRSPVTDDSVAALRKALAHASCVVVGKAARIIGELEIQTLCAELASAFDRFMVEPARTDKGCTAKAAIAETLYQLGSPSDAIFIRGIRHRQMEGSFGPPVDVAVDLRGSCAMGLVRMAHPDMMLELGDDDPMVVGECLGSLMKMEPRGSLEFVGRFLDREEQVADLAALSLGGSRLPEALEMLKKWYGRSVDAQTKRTALLAIAMLRMEPAVLFLLERLAAESGPDARAAIEALAIYRHDASIRPRVEKAMQKRPDKRLLSEDVERLFSA